MVARAHSSKPLTGFVLACLAAGQMICLPLRGNIQILKSFDDRTDNAHQPSGGLIQGMDGSLYGATTFGGAGGSVFKINLDGTGFSVLHFFGTSSGDSTNPAGPLVFGSDHALYGVSYGGLKGKGSVFRLNADGTDYRVLNSFGISEQDGTLPQAPLVQGPPGILFGVTYSGGASNLGTVFRLNQDGTGYQVLHSFQGSPMEGAYPSGVLIGTDGAFYGTTSSGGTNLTFSGGTVFKLNGDGTGFRLLHSFGGTLNDGAYPQSLLLLAKDDILYGTAGSGNIFRLKTDGTDFLVVHNFPHDLQLGVPQTLVQGEDGSLYGLTGQVQAPGSAFRINPDGAEYTVLHIFGSDLHDGRTPKGPLLQGSDGAFYGATSFGGAAFQGTVFRMTVSSSLPPPFVLAVIPSADGSFHIQFDGVVGYNYQLETSTNLADWSSVGTVSNETGQVQFLDANQSKAARKFYRVGIAQ